MLRNLILTRLVEPLAEKFGHKELERAALAAAFITGIGLFRTSQYMAPLLTDEGIKKLEPVLRDVINAIASEV